MSNPTRPAPSRTLGEHIAALEKAGKLVRITAPVNKDTELHPLVRLQFRGLEEKQRRAFLFENVVDVHGKKYDIPVLVGALAGSDDIYAVGMNCAVEEINDRWDAALKSPIPPRIVSEAPCQEVRITGDALNEPGGGLGRLPHPISTPGLDNAPYTTASHWITREPDTGIHNVGNYRGMIKSETRLGVLPAALGQGMRRHIDLWRAKGEKRVPAAIVIGAPPFVTYAAVTRIPNEVCEYDVAGSLYGEPLDVVRCLTHDLLVPAQSEIVIEGWIPTEELEVEGPFGEFPGYMAKRDHSYFMDVTCITMRRKPIYLSIISQLPPSESSKLRHVGRNAAARSMLHKLGFTNVVDVNYLESSGSYPLVVVKLKTARATPRKC
jgi:UbiD family decarboxylase